MDNFPVDTIFDLASTLVNLTSEQKRILQDMLKNEYGMQIELKEIHKE